MISIKQDRINEYPIPRTMKAWVLGNPEELALVEKPVPEPGAAEVLVRVDAIAVCATDIEIVKHGLPAMVDGGLPFNRGFTPGHEYMGTVVRLGPTVDEFRIGDRIAVEVHAGCGRCQRCREGMYYLVPQLRVPREGAPRQRLQHRWRLRRICGQQY